MKHLAQHGDLIFSERVDGSLEFVGKFNELYQTVADPWNQSGADGVLIAEYYRYSRARLVGGLWAACPPPKTIKVLEVGCGHGYATRMIAARTWYAEVHGCDISPAAIERAEAFDSRCRFYVADIRRVTPPDTYDAVIWNQILWYILDELGAALENSARALVPGGYLIVSQAYLKGVQRYGKEIANGFHGALRALMLEGRSFTLINADYQEKSQHTHRDGIMVFRRRL